MPSRRRESVDVRVIVKAFIVASAIGLLVPLSVVAMIFLASWIFGGWKSLLRALGMIVFGLFGLGLGTFAFTKVLPFITPRELKRREQQTS